MRKLTCTIPLNYQGMVELDTNFGGTSNWVKLAAGITGIIPANNDSVDQKQYIDGQGFGSSDVIGMQITLAVAGDRFLTDAAQNFIFDNQYEIGCGRKTQCRITEAEGKFKVCGCTIANIVPPSGESANKKAFTFEIHFNGRPTFSPATSAPALTSTVADGSVSGSTSFTATPKSGNTFGYLLTASAPTTPNLLAYVNVYAYTSGDPIAAAVGQILNMVELDINKRVAKYAKATLTSGEILA